MSRETRVSDRTVASALDRCRIHKHQIDHTALLIVLALVVDAPLHLAVSHMGVQSTVVVAFWKVKWNRTENLFRTHTGKPAAFDTLQPETACQVRRFRRNGCDDSCSETQAGVAKPP